MTSCDTHTLFSYNCMFGLPHQRVWFSEGWSYTHSRPPTSCVMWRVLLSLSGSSVRQSPPGIFRSVLLSSTPSDWQREKRVCANSVIPPRSCYDRSPHTLASFFFFHCFPCSLSSLFSHTHTQSLAPPFLSFSSFIFMLECLEHVRFVYNGNLTPPFPPRLMLCVFSPIFSLRTHTHRRIWGRGGENQADYKASLIWLRHRGNFLSLLPSPPLHRSLPLSPLLWQRRWLRSRGSDWFNYCTDEPARRRQKSYVISRKTSQPLHYQPLMRSLHIHAGVIASDSRKENGVTSFSCFTSALNT